MPYLMDTSGGTASLGPGAQMGLLGMNKAQYDAWLAARTPKSQGGTMPDPVDLSQEREAILGLFQNDQQFYNQGPAADLRNQIMARANGTDSPFSQQVTGGMFADNAAAGAGQFASERDMLQRSLGNAGLGGSGAETRALINAKTRAQHQMAAGRREINSRAALENFSARERGQQAAQSFLGQQAGHQQQGAFAEAGFRSQATATEERPGSEPSGPKLLASGAVHDQGAWDRQINDLLKRMEAMQQQSIQGTQGSVKAAPGAAPWDPSLGGSAPVGYSSQPVKYGGRTYGGGSIYGGASSTTSNPSMPELPGQYMNTGGYY